jgi:hypothetical protein
MIVAAALAVAGVALLPSATTSRAAVAVGAPHVPAPVACHGCWHPPLQSRWQYQLQGIKKYREIGGINIGLSARPAGATGKVHPVVWDIDLWVDQKVSGNDHTLSKVAVRAIHMLQGHAICYVDAGTFENWRPDVARFPSSVLGDPNGWPGERWLDIRQVGILGPIMRDRVRLCAQTGFDAVEFDNVDGYTNRTGFPLSAADQLAFNRFLARAAHARGLSIGLKNDLDQAATLEPDFDWALDEQCFQYHECDRLQPFVRARKAVFVAEYELDTASFCPQARAAGLMAMRKRTGLDAWRETCW